AIIGAAAAGVAIATAIAASSTNDEHKQNRRATTSFTSAVISDAASTTSDVARWQTYNLADEKAEWEKSFLQKTTLDPGCSIRGKVFINYDSKAYFYKLFIPIDNQELQLLFKQRKYDPRN
ncbi:MAG: hypothetical protein Q8862_11605, partial [Bacteroidota bacterium]|nr:hypothetical protein [Bacteroidota bacterium]